MKDIDFDELDRAVGSVLGTTKQPKPAPAAPAPTPTAAPVPQPEASASPAPTVTPSAPSPAPVTPPTPRPTPPTPSRPATITAPTRPTPALRRSGRFMDVLHPSSDMTGRGPSLPVSHGVAPKLVPSTPSPTTPPAAPVADEDKPSTPAASFDLSSVVQPAQPKSLEDEGQSETAADSMMPVQSPFLEGAKVEKRPLGSFGFPVEGEQSDDASQSPSDTQHEEPEKTTAEDVEEAKARAALPPELQAEALDAEDRDIVEVEQPAEPDMSTQDNSTPSVQAAPSPSEASTAPASSGPVLTQSIAPQYQRDDKQDDDVAASVFNSADYHEPLVAHTGSNRKRIILTVVLVVLLLIVGAGIGYAAYVYQLGS